MTMPASGAFSEAQVTALSVLLRDLLRHGGLLLTFTVAQGRPGDRPQLVVTFEGEDLPLLDANRGELLLALEHVAAKALRLEHEEHDLLSFDAAGFKSERDNRLRKAAEEALRAVTRTRQPYPFQPMSSRDRRMLHLLLTAAGLKTISEGEGNRRHLVAHPAGSGRASRPST